MAKKAGCKIRTSNTGLQLRSYGGFLWEPKGKTEAQCKIGKQTENLEFLVVDKGLVPLISLETAYKFKLISRLHPDKEGQEPAQLDPVEAASRELRGKMPETAEEFIRQNPEIFNGLGQVPGIVGPRV